MLDRSLSDLHTSSTDDDVGFRAIGAVLCWAVAGVLYYKSWRKRQQRNRRQRQESNNNESTRSLPSSIVVDHTVAAEGAIPNGKGNGTSHEETTPLATEARTRQYDRATSSLSYDTNAGAMALGGMPDEIRPLVGNSPTWLVVCLTVLGSLDEVAYFPGLVVGEVFTVSQLCLGTLFASVLVLLLVDLLARRCMICIAVLDQIPLYAIVVFFAFWLTLKVIYDLANRA